MEAPPATLSHGLAPLDFFMIAVILISVLLVGFHASLEAHGLSWSSAIRKFGCGLTPGVNPRAWLYLGTPTDQGIEMMEHVGSTLREEAREATAESDAVGAGEVSNPANSASNFFLADRSMAFYFVGASLFASNIGSEHFVGQAGDGARRGIAVALYEWYATFLLIALGWIFAPLYARAGIYTTPEFLEHRFNKHCRNYLAVVTCIMYVVTKMSASIYGGAVILSSALGWDLYVSAGACILLSAMYTVSGGLRAVMYTDLVQTIVFVLGGLVVAGTTLNKVGGLQGLRARLEEQGRSDHWELLKPAADPDYPWTGMLIGQPIGSLWYWCMDQDLVQRTLAARSDVHTKAGCTMAAALKLLAPFFTVVPGMAVGVLFDFSAAGSVATDQAYPVLLTAVMPPGVRGIMVASIMAAMMSSLDSVFNAGSAVFTFDIYARLFPGASDATLERVGQAATVAFAVLSFLWIPVISSGAGLYRQVVELQAYLTPPVGVVFLMGVTLPRVNGAGALAGLLSGGALGLARMAASLTVPRHALPSLPAAVRALLEMNFQHFAILLWVLSAFACAAGSLATPAPDPARVHRLTVHWRGVGAPAEGESPIVKRRVRPLLAAAAAAVTTATLSLFFVFR